MDRTAATRMQRYRNKKRNEGVTKSPESVTVSVTEPLDSVTVDVTPYHPILKYLVQGKNRQKMETIIESLKGHRAFGLNDIYYGIGKYAISMDTVDELLGATGKGCPA